jgi:hypothetical protein
MQVQTAQQLWLIYMQLPPQEKQVFRTQFQQATEEPTKEEEKPVKVPISSLRKKRNLRTTEEIDAEILAMREEWERGF